jgi:two-component system, NtrC family, nitrogen regulation sensor histidine kinase NtrY
VEALESAGLDSIEDPEILIAAGIEGEEAVISISDNGNGWPAQDRHKLLEPYMTTREKGTGLGLAIVAKIIEQHGGRVDLRDSEPDRNGRVGACFAFTLSLHDSGTQPRDAGEAAVQGSQKSTDQEEASRLSAMAFK